MIIQLRAFRYEKAIVGAGRVITVPAQSVVVPVDSTVGDLKQYTVVSLRAATTAVSRTDAVRFFMHEGRPYGMREEEDSEPLSRLLPGDEVRDIVPFFVLPADAESESESEDEGGESEKEEHDRLLRHFKGDYVGLEIVVNRGALNYPRLIKKVKSFGEGSRIVIRGTLATEMALAGDYATYINAICRGKTDEEMGSIIDQLRSSRGLPAWVECVHHEWPSVASRVKYNFPDPSIVASRRAREVAERGIPAPQDFTTENKRRILGLCSILCATCWMRGPARLWSRRKREANELGV